MSNKTLYLLANLAVLVMVAVGAGAHPNTGVHPVYLLPLFALCSSPLLVIRKFNDRYALLGIFSAIYFMFFGITDLVELLDPPPGIAGDSSLISATELVVLAGILCATVGYYLGALRVPKSAAQGVRDWNEYAVWSIGLGLWVLFTALSWHYKVHIVTDTSFEAGAKAFATTNAAERALYVTANTLQPLTILIIAYAQCRYRRTAALPIVVGVVLVQLVLGFVVDVKGDALIGAAIVIFTKLMIDAKLPKTWILAAAVFITLAFPVLQANRYVRGEYGVDHSHAAENLGDIVRRSVEATRFISSGQSRASNFFERLTMKGPLDMIVTRSGVDVPYQHGHTLVPLALVFVPRLIMPDKPDVQTGQLVNSEFKVSGNAYTYISPSHLGELYWNFGWPGAAGGMLVIGLLLGYVGARFNLAEAATLTRLMVMVVSIQALVIGFESSIASQYAVWLRAMLAIGVLHALFARRRQSPEVASVVTNVSPMLAPAGPHTPFPNLLR